MWRIFHLILQCFQDCMQSVRVLSNLELEKLVTIFVLFSGCSWSVLGQLSAWCFLLKLKYEASDKTKKNDSLK